MKKTEKRTEPPKCNFISNVTNFQEISWFIGKIRDEILDEFKELKDDIKRLKMEMK